MVKSLLIRWVVLAIAVGITTWLLPGLNFSGDLLTLFLMSAVLGFLMAVLKPILMLLTYPARRADTRTFHVGDQYLHPVRHLSSDLSEFLSHRHLLVGAAGKHHYQRHRHAFELSAGRGIVRYRLPSSIACSSAISR